jgi:hypothetical protein
MRDVSPSNDENDPEDWVTVTKPVSVTGNGYVQRNKRGQPKPFINDTGIVTLTA